MKCEQE